MPTSPRRRALTIHDIADIRAALDLAHDLAGDHGETFRKADRALDRVALGVAKASGRERPTPPGCRRRLQRSSASGAASPRIEARRGA